MKGNLSGAHTGVDSGAILPGLKSQVLAHPETWDQKSGFRGVSFPVCLISSSKD